jgi:hypothetical protein
MFSDIILLPSGIILLPSSITLLPQTLPCSLRHYLTSLSLKDYPAPLLQTISLLRLSLLLPHNLFLQRLRLSISKTRNKHLLSLFDEQHVLILALFLAALRAPVLQLSDPALPLLSSSILFSITESNFYACFWKSGML